MLPGHNTSIISYKYDAPRSFELIIRPLINSRDFHSRTKEKSGLAFTQHPVPCGVRIGSNFEVQSLYLRSSSGVYESSEAWYRNMVYDLEAERGLNDREDHFNPGLFKATLKGQGFFKIVASTDMSDNSNLTTPSVNAYSSGNHLRDWLIHFSNHFTVKHLDEGCTIVAGYHWFGEWGRDAAIALPGLLLTTGRFEEAKDVLNRYLKRYA